MTNANRDTVLWPRDSTIVGVNNPIEVEFWCGRFDANPDELKAAVRKVGPYFKNVDNYLRTGAGDDPRTQGKRNPDGRG